MTINIRCDNCSSTLKVPDKHAGKRAKCPSCGTILAIPAAEVAPVSAPETPGPSAFPQVPPQSPPPPSTPQQSNTSQPVPAKQPAENLFGGINTGGGSTGSGPQAEQPASPYTEPHTAGNAAASAPNPYSSPGHSHPGGQGPGGNGVAPEEFRPLYEARFFMKVAGWTQIVLGALYCLSIVGIIGGGIMLWMGICIKNANDRLQRGFETNDRMLLREANKSLATYFSIIGVLMLIGAVMLTLGVGFFALSIFAAAVAG